MRKREGGWIGECYSTFSALGEKQAALSCPSLSISWESERCSFLLSTGLTPWNNIMQMLLPTASFLSGTASLGFTCISVSLAVCHHCCLQEPVLLSSVMTFVFWMSTCLKLLLFFLSALLARKHNQISFSCWTVFHWHCCLLAHLSTSGICSLRPLAISFSIGQFLVYSLLISWNIGKGPPISCHAHPFGQWWWLLL